MNVQSIGQLASEVKLRSAVADDLHFIQDTWLKGFGLSDFAKAVPHGLYAEGQLRRMARILSHAEAVVACAPEDESTVLGYAIFQRQPRPVLHWAYTKHAFRRLGLLRLMLMSQGLLVSGLEYTHQTDKARKVARAFGASFNPYALENA